MGAGASANSNYEEILQAERNKPLNGSDIDTPRGISAKEEVIF